MQFTNVTMPIQSLARAMGDGLAIALLAGGEIARTEFYNEVYLPLVLKLKKENSSFDSVAFSYWAGRQEGTFLRLARENSGRFV